MAYFFNEENEPNYVPNRTGKGAGCLDHVFSNGVVSFG